MHLKQYGIREHYLNILSDLIVLNKDSHCMYLSEIDKYPVSPLFTYSCTEEKHIRKLLRKLNVHNIIHYDLRPEAYVYKVINCSGVDRFLEFDRKLNERSAIIQLIRQIAKDANGEEK
jgi:hypothetical protein